MITRRSGDKQPQDYAVTVALLDKGGISRGNRTESHAKHMLPLI